MNLLFERINSEVALSSDEFKVIEQQFEQLDFSKNAFIIKPNQLGNTKFFVLKGCLRSYFLDSSGKEHTVQFAIEGSWIGDYTSYFTGEKSILYVECLEECTLLRTYKHQWDKLYKKIPKLESYARVQLEKGLASTHKKTVDNLTLSNKEKYLNFVKNYPEIERRVKNYHIASFLGITAESLSRIRKQ